VLVGLFLFDAEPSVVRHDRNMKQATVADAMSASLAIEPDVTISHFVDAVLPLHRRTSFPVARLGKLHGILALEDLKQLPRERWRETRARDVMRPVDATLFVQAGATMARADELMRQNGLGALAVTDQAGRLVGYLQQGRLRKVKTRK